MILLELMAIPFVLAGAVIFAIAAAVVIMLPFQVCLLLVLYNFNWREMLDMEFGTHFRRFPELPKPKKPKLEVIHGRK